MGKYRCDTGFGPGKLNCYNQQCRTSAGALNCVTKSKRFQKSGILRVGVPSGYVITGGGVYNHYRHFNAKAGFEESFPEGNQWRGDMGFGAGDFTVYARGCKAPHGYKLQCITRKGPSNSNLAHATCPTGYQLTGCGINNQHRTWDKLSQFEAAHPNGNKCTCDSGIGHGKNTCYARCCKSVVDPAVQKKEKTSKAAKEKAAKERNGKEKGAKEKTAKERKNKEMKMKERVAKEKKGKEIKLKEKKSKEMKMKELKTKEKKAKEKTAKESNAKEKTYKEKGSKERKAKEVG